jgi:hypothetical protein
MGIIVGGSFHQKKIVDPDRTPKTTTKYRIFIVAQFDSSFEAILSTAIASAIVGLSAPSDPPIPDSRRRSAAVANTAATATPSGPGNFCSATSLASR